MLEDDGSLALPSAPRRPNELAAHKLLDAVGDSLLYGGVFRGSLRIERPGHTANHAIFRRALSEGILTPVI